MKREILPIGSVVLLKNATKRLMITGYNMQEKNHKKIYDYCGCLYPEGILDTKSTALFDSQQIEKIYHKGLEDEEATLFINNIVAKTGSNKNE